MPTQLAINARRDAELDMEKSNNPAPSLLTEAVRVLRASRKPLTCPEILTRIMAAGRWTTQGRTPVDTLSSAIISREMKKATPRIKRVGRGMYEAVREGK